MSSISFIISSHRPDLESYITLYKHFHTHPELSHQELETAATVATRLRALNSALTVKTGIGGDGIAAVWQHGPGPTILLRADMDALPVRERTGLPYASTATQVSDEDGAAKPVMHACGHDMHMTSLLAALELLTSAQAAWSGTLVLIFQPAEEKGAGAQRMVDDGLYTTHGVPVPDVVLGGHVMPYRAGTVSTRRGLMASSADSMTVTLFGRGGHASQPHKLVDPVLMAASTVVRLQGIVAREVDPLETAVVTCGCILSGDAENVVADTATLKLDVRAMSQATRDKVLKSLERIVRAESMASAATKEPEFVTTRCFPFTWNDEAVTRELEASFGAHFEVGPHGYSSDAPRLGGSEDYSILATAVNKPCSFFVYGGVPPDVWDTAEKEGKLESLPINHSGLFAPAIMPTLQVAVDAYALAALTWLAKK